MLTDSHCHLFYDQILKDIDNVFYRSKKLGVNRFICVGTNINDSLLSLDIAKKFENVYCSAGVHPHDAQNVEKNYLQQIESMMRSEKMIAIGEIGLDYFRNISSKKSQIKVFNELLQLADKINKPVTSIYKLEIVSNVTLPYGVIMELKNEVEGWDNQDLTKKTITILKNYENEMSGISTTNLEVKGALIDVCDDEVNDNNVEITGEFTEGENKND